MRKRGQALFISISPAPAAFYLAAARAVIKAADDTANAPEIIFQNFTLRSNFFVYTA
jgi:hypothetical protein